LEPEAFGRRLRPMALAGHFTFRRHRLAGGLALGPGWRQRRLLDVGVGTRRHDDRGSARVPWRHPLVIRVQRIAAEINTVALAVLDLARRRGDIGRWLV